jgi:hypothetical protein
LKPTLRAGGLTSGVNLDRGPNIERNLPAMVFLRLFANFFVGLLISRIA